MGSIIPEWSHNIPEHAFPFRDVGPRHLSIRQPIHPSRSRTAATERDGGRPNAPDQWTKHSHDLRGAGRPSESSSVGRALPDG